MATFSIFNASPAPVIGAAFNDNVPVELGMAFTVIKAGWITELLYYRPQQGSNVAVARELRLWRHSTKALLATAQATTPSGTFGWQKAKLTTPVKIAASTRYVVSYRTNDWYQSASNYFNSTDEVAFDGRDDNAYSDPSGTVRAGQSSSTYANGVYVYGSSIVMPSQTFQKCNYWLDVVFTDQDPGVVTPPVVLPVVTLAVSPATVAEDGTANSIYTFTRTGDIASPLTVNYTVGGTATNGTDYTGISATGTTKTVSFAAGSATATVTVDPTADSTVETDESVTISIVASSGYTVGTPGSATASIVNDDATPPPPPPTGAPTTGWTVNENNIGLKAFGINGASLPLYTGPASPTANTVISGKRIQGPLNCIAGNITIERCLFQPTSLGDGGAVVTTGSYFNNRWNPPAAKVTIQDCEFDASSLPLEDAAKGFAFSGVADMRRNYVRGFGVGIYIFNAGTQLDCLIEHNYVHRTPAFGDPGATGNHIDAFSIRGFTDAQRPDRVCIVRNNRFDADAASNVTGACFLQAWDNRIDNVSIEGNLLAGNGYNLILEANSGGYSNISAINNRFAPAGYGATYYTGGSGWALWRDNYLYDSTKIDAKGAPVGP